MFPVSCNWKISTIGRNLFVTKYIRYFSCTSRNNMIGIIFKMLFRKYNTYSTNYTLFQSTGCAVFYSMPLGKNNLLLCQKKLKETRSDYQNYNIYVLKKMFPNSTSKFILYIWQLRKKPTKSTKFKMCTFNLRSSLSARNTMMY